MCCFAHLSSFLASWCLLALTLQVLGEVNAGVGRTPSSTSKKYTKLTQLEHVLVRPDTYIGSVEKIQDTMVV